MALPLDNRQLDDIASMTTDYRIPDVVDNVFASNPLFARLKAKNQLSVDGGDKIRQPIIYAKLNSAWYSGSDTFDVSQKETETDMIFNWKQHEVNITITGKQKYQNAGAAKVRDIVTQKMDNAKLTASDDFGTALFGDGTASGGKVITGLRAAVDDGTTYTTYGGITRDTSAEGTAVKGHFDTTGGVFSLSLMNTTFGAAVIGNTKPNLIVTTQTIWNKWWDRAQPAQRFVAGDGPGADIGFDYLRFNGADVVVDSHCPAGFVYFLQTDFIKLVFNSERVFNPSGWKYPTNQDSLIQQLFSMCELVVQSPRLQSAISNVT